MSEKLKPKDVMKWLNISHVTLCKWDKIGKLKSRRSSSNRRYYLKEDIYKFLNVDIKSERLNILYARVSNSQQKDDLKNQKLYLFDYIKENKLNNIEYFEDIGSGLNYNRKKWNEILDLVENDKVENIIVSFKDRFVRFGFEWFEEFCKKHDTNIIVLNEIKLSPIEEITEDLVSIIHVFSSRIYGLRKYKDKIKNESN